MILGQISCINGAVTFVTLGVILVAPRGGSQSSYLSGQFTCEKLNLNASSISSQQTPGDNSSYPVKLVLEIMKRIKTCLTDLSN